MRNFKLVRMMHACVMLLAVLWVCGSASAELRLPAVFSDHGVLQRDQPLPVWGWAEAGAEVVVSLDGKPAQTTADAKGRWRVTLEARPAGGPYELTVQSGDATLSRRDIMVGEVWLCSGQSNMDLALSKASPSDTATANLPNVRLFYVARELSGEPKDDVRGAWSPCTPESVKGFSAAAFYFGRVVQPELGVTVGLIHSAYGGTPAEAWTSIEALRAEPKLKPILDRDTETSLAYEASLRAYESAVATGAKAEKPAAWSNRDRPTYDYNGMISPLIPYGLRGVLWYQGEANATRATQYRTLLPTMIRDWRQRWGQVSLPFGIVQLPNYVPPPSLALSHYALGWPELREAQLVVSRELPDVGLITTIDVGEPTDIHPLDKKTVGERLARWALVEVYAKEGEPMGPLFREASFEGDKVYLSFDHLGGGLATRDGGPVKGFVVAGKDGKFRWAKAEIEGDRLVITEERIKEPVAVRYAWDHNPYWANLVGRNGLPASPFRTDDWPALTRDNE